MGVKQTTFPKSASSVPTSRSELSALPPQAKQPTTPHNWCWKSFTTALSQHKLFNGSFIERCLAMLVRPLTRLFSFRHPPVVSHAVAALTLWERLLCHQSRVARQMTFAASYHGYTCHHEDFACQAITALSKYILESETQWQNQPLLVEVNECCRTRQLDPRHPTAGLFRIAIVTAGNTHVCELDMQYAAQLTALELTTYVERQVATAQPSNQLVSAIIDTEPRPPQQMAGSYVARPGAWLRIAPNALQGGLLVTADHLVLDGAMFQDLLFAVLRGSSVEREQRAEETAPAFETAQTAPISILQLGELDSICELVRQIAGTLQEFGLELDAGNDAVLLVTIPQAGPSLDESVAKHRRRVLPLLFNLAATDDAEAIRTKIVQLNETGWNSLSAQVWSQIYAGNVWNALVQYFQLIAPYVPLQRTSKYLAGSALLTFLPPVKVPEHEAANLQNVSVRTMNPMCGGPTIAVSQVRSLPAGQAKIFITISGSRHWNRLDRLTDFRDALARRLSAVGISTMRHEEHLPPIAATDIAVQNFSGNQSSPLVRSA